MKQVFKYLFPSLILFLNLNLFAQDFFREEYDQKKTNILLVNPTIYNIKTVSFLVEQKLLNVNPNKVRFVGIYYENQSYDFTNSKTHIEQEGPANFFLHEFRGSLDKNSLFDKNTFSEEMKQLFQNSAGIFFFGGPDIPPEVYGKENTLSVVTDPERHYFETTFLFHLLGGYWNEEFEPFLNENPDYFVTGFCLGMQTMNVATGGTLIQDIPAEIYGAETPESTIETGKLNMHRNYWQIVSDDPLLMRINFHPIKFTDHPFFGRRVKFSKKAEPLIYSSHHQAAEKLGKGMEITALSPDGKVVEALAHSYYPNVFSVQFHPEIPALYKNREAKKFHPDDEPRTYYEIIGREGLKFHKRYWKFISKAIRKASR